MKIKIVSDTYENNLSAISVSDMGRIIVYVPVTIMHLLDKGVGRIWPPE